VEGEPDAAFRRLIGTVTGRRETAVDGGNGGFDMARTFAIAAVIAAIAVACPASSFAATASGAPTLTTTPYVAPATFVWTPAANGPDPLDPNTSQQVYRGDGACPDGTVTGGGPIGAALPMTAATHTTSTTIPDGIYCFHIRTASLLGGVADGPGLTVAIDRSNPTGTIAVAPAAPGNIVSGAVDVSGTSADAVSGVASSTFHVGAVNACASGVVIDPVWDTTTQPNGSYQVCNVITDNAGHVAVVSTAVTIANPVAPPGTPVAAPVAGTAVAPLAATPPVVANPIADPVAPNAPTKITVILPRAKASTGMVSVGLRWVKPAASDLARIVVVLNPKRPPRSPADGTKAYTGLGTSTSLRLRAGSTVNVALFAYDRSDNISSPARKVVSLAPLIPLRPTTGSSVSTAPRLFHNGSRVLMGWPAQAAFRIPAGKLTSGTYVWFVWPAVRHRGAAPTFGKLIGRATFVYKKP
jgi:hypothetical protein